jgi:hypothetical protein
LNFDSPVISRSGLILEMPLLMSTGRYEIRLCLMGCVSVRTSGGRGSKMKMISWRIVFVAGVLTIVANVAANAQVACPPNIKVEQKAVAPSDWSVDYSKKAAALSSATIFDGPPQEQASLKYDDERTTKDEIIQTWALPASDRGYWIECGYTNTAALLRRKLPNDMRTCKVVFEKGVTFGDGGAVAKRAECSIGSPEADPLGRSFLAVLHSTPCQRDA